MDIDAFRASLAEPTPAKGAKPLLKAMWHAAREEWAAAHHIAQDVDTADGDRVHAHLHGSEGEEDNAGYWYRLPGNPHCERLSERRLGGTWSKRTGGSTFWRKS